jgi:hypothetical protein
MKGKIVASHGTPRFSRPRLRDPRVLIGVVLVLASVLGTWFIVRQAAQTTRVWAAAHVLVPGAVLAEGDLTATEVSLPGNAGAYLSAHDAAPIGSTVLRSVGAGELVPAGQLGSQEQLQGRLLSLDLSESLPQAVTAGSRVDIWAADSDAETVEPKEILSGIDVVNADHSAGGFAQASGARLEVFVPTDKLSQILAAQASGHRISAVSVPAATTEAMP